MTNNSLNYARRKSLEIRFIWSDFYLLENYIDHTAMHLAVLVEIGNVCREKVGRGDESWIVW